MRIEREVEAHRRQRPRRIFDSDLTSIYERLATATSRFLL
jgi:hypothetical protein